MDNTPAWPMPMLGLESDRRQPVKTQTGRIKSRRYVRGRKVNSNVTINFEMRAPGTTSEVWDSGQGLHCYETSVAPGCAAVWLRVRLSARISGIASVTGNHPSNG